MQVKLFEVRDRHTFIPVMAIKLDPRNESERYLLSVAGYGLEPDTQREYVVVVKINGDSLQAQHDPYHWENMGRTMTVAHAHIVSHWDALASGAVVDVEYVVGESAAPKPSEALCR